jgi:phosphopantothenate synthetase
MAKINQQIETLQEKLKQLKARQVALENRQKAKNLKRERKEDTRRKILVGAVVLSKVEDGSLDKKLLNGWLEAALTRDDDRALFGLDEKRG